MKDLSNPGEVADSQWFNNEHRGNVLSFGFKSSKQWAGENVVSDLEAEVLHAHTHTHTHTHTHHKQQHYDLSFDIFFFALIYLVNMS